jgi:glycopeptide antibiotics resistance protein
MTTQSTARGHLWLIGFGYLLFVIYGSLVPLDFHALPLDTAVTRFQAVPWLDLGIGSRADWVANLLLFIPLAFIFTGALAHGRGVAVLVAVSLLVMAAGLGLAISIEFTQLFFPQRTVSQNDIAAETLGGILGVASWWLFGARLVAWYESWLHVREPAALSERLAWGYVGIAFAYGVLPLDLTISAVEIYHKWGEGKLVLIPFSALPDDPAQAFYEVFTDILLWLPPALLWRMGGKTGARAWRMAFAAALLLEVLQLFVYSRVTDVSDLLAAALGAWIGVLLGARLGPKNGRAPPRMQADAGMARWRPLLLAFAWLPVLMLVFWYPFDFRTDGAFVRERLDFLGHVPFEIYYFGTEFRAITSVFNKLLFFAPLGALLAWWVVGLPWLWRSYAAAASMMFILAAALAIELGQVLLPSKYPDTTDWFLESLGGILGYVLLRIIRPASFGLPATANAPSAYAREADGVAGLTGEIDARYCSAWHSASAVLVGASKALAGRARARGARLHAAAGLRIRLHATGSGVHDSVQRDEPQPDSSHLAGKILGRAALAAVTRLAGACAGRALALVCGVQLFLGHAVGVLGEIPLWC